MFVFELSAESAEEFYRRAKELNAVTEEQRTHILLDMVRDGLIVAAFQTDATHAEIVEVLQQHYEIIRVKGSDVDVPEGPGTAGN